MALGTPTLVTPTVGANGTSLNTASFTPTGDALLLACGCTRVSVLPDPITMSGGSLTWTPVGAGLYDPGGGGARNRAGAFAAIVPSSPSSMTVTTGAVGGAKLVLTVIQITGQLGIPSNFDDGDNGSGDPATVLGTSPAASSTVILFGSFNGGTPGVSTPAGFTQLDSFLQSDLTLHSCYDAASAAASNAYTSVGSGSAAIAIEVASAGGGGGGGGARVPIGRSGRFLHLLVR